MSDKPVSEGIKERKLTNKQELFCVKYVQCGNATEAYKFAYNCKKMKPATINRNAKTLMDNSNIATRIKELQQETADKLLVSKDSVLREHANIGFSDVRKFFKGNGEMVRLVDLDRETASAISSFKVVTRNVGHGEVEHVAEVKLWNKISSLENLAKLLDLFPKQEDGKDDGYSAAFAKLIDKLPG